MENAFENELIAGLKLITTTNVSLIFTVGYDKSRMDDAEKSR